MGLKKAYLEFINQCIGGVFTDMAGKRMLELGNQETLEQCVPEKTGKDYFSRRGIEHVSVDLNGQDGALALDLTKPEQFYRWHGYFDIITNAGTTEHIEPQRVQYEAFSIIHDCLKPGGIAIHLLPDSSELREKGAWKGHCFNYYSREFFVMLAQQNNYQLSMATIIDGQICACVRKTQQRPFMSDRALFLRHIVRSRHGLIYPGVNDRALRYLPRRIYGALMTKTYAVRHRLGLYTWWRKKAE